MYHMQQKRVHFGSWNFVLAPGPAKMLPGEIDEAHARARSFRNNLY